MNKQLLNVSFSLRSRARRSVPSGEKRVYVLANLGLVIGIFDSLNPKAKDKFQIKLYFIHSQKIDETK